MLAIGRALMTRPKVLLLDEPSLGLSPILVQQIFAIIREINASGTTILLVEQNALQALEVADRGYVLQTGRVILADTAANLAANEDVRGPTSGRSERAAASPRSEARMTDRRVAGDEPPDGGSPTEAGPSAPRRGDRGRCSASIVVAARSSPSR